MKRNKDVYEHLANVYLNASTRNKKKILPRREKVPFKVRIVVSVCIIIVLILVIFKQRPIAKGKHTLVLEASPARLSYNFDLAERETLMFDLKDINLEDFKILGFRVRKSDHHNNLHMCIEFVSEFGERSQVYIKQIPAQWQNFKIQLSDFKAIGNWTRMRQLLFTFEEWNAQIKKSTVYIDNVYFLN